MWENFWVELAKLVPQFAVTFFGVFLAFSLDRVIDWIYRRRDRNDLLRDLREELEETKSKLTGKGYMLCPDIWDSAISSGQIRLLNSEQVTKLARVYRYIKGTEYEAGRVRDLAEDYRRRERIEVEHGHVPWDSKPLKELWRDYSIRQKSREEITRTMIEEILKEEWLARIRKRR